MCVCMEHGQAQVGTRASATSTQRKSRRRLLHRAVGRHFLESFHPDLYPFPRGGGRRPIPQGDVLLVDHTMEY